jgi:hypothetical protein
MRIRSQMKTQNNELKFGGRANKIKEESNEKYKSTWAPILGRNLKNDSN